MNAPLRYTGGIAQTNAYLIPSLNGDGYLCIDAPEGIASLIRKKKLKIDALLLTHGHFDHVWDAGLLEEAHGCPVFIHPADEPLVRDISYVKRFGLEATFPLPKTITPLNVPLEGTMEWESGGRKFHLSHISGHSLGSVTFYEPAEKRLFGGDILFAGGVGRWDLPGGSQQNLVQGIRRHLLPLPEETVVYPGHGSETTIGAEKRSNPYVYG